MFPRSGWLWCAVVLFSGAQTKAAIFQGLGDLPGGDSGSHARAVSADGLTVVGGSSTASGYEAFRWTNSNGMTNFGAWGLPQSGALAVSANGSTVVGTRERQGSPRPFVFTPCPVSYPSSFKFGAAEGVSADGSIVVGSTNYLGPAPNAFGFRWTVGGSEVRLSGIVFGWEALAHGVSADGNVVVGQSYTGAGSDCWWEPTVWSGDWAVGTKIGTGLGRLAGAHEGDALAVSADGTTIVGHSGQMAFRWAGGMVGLGYLPGDYKSDALAVSGDGAIVAGWSRGSGTQRAFIWDEVNGMRDVAEFLRADLGLDLSGWSLVTVSGVSADGKVLVGLGINPQGGAEAWMAELTPVPEPSTFVIWSVLGALGIATSLWRKRKAA